MPRPPGEVPAFLPSANDWAESNGNFPYTLYEITTSYPRSTGILQLPVAGEAGDPAHIVQVAAPYGKKLVEWVVERQGAKPELPLPEEDTDEQVLESAGQVFRNSRLLPNGLTRIYRAAGSYTYVLTAPFVEGDDYMKTGAPPFQTKDGENEVNQVTPSQFGEGIV